jgi:Transposase DDE domain
LNLLRATIDQITKPSTRRTFHPCVRHGATQIFSSAESSWPAYNVQTAVDTEHALIVAQKVSDDATDNRSLLPMAEAAKTALGNPKTLNLVAGAGYSNGRQAEQCEPQGVVLHVPANRSINNQGDGTLFDRSRFHYDESTDTYRCLGQQTQARKQLQRNKTRVIYAGDPVVCGACTLKSRCTRAPQRVVNRHLHDGVLQRMQQRATPAMMRLRRSMVEHPFASLKYRIFGHPRFLLRGVRGAQAEISLATMVYNLKRMLNVLGAIELQQALAR